MLFGVLREVIIKVVEKLKVVRRRVIRANRNKISSIGAEAAMRQAFAESFHVRLRDGKDPGDRLSFGVETPVADSSGRCFDAAQKPPRA